MVPSPGITPNHRWLQVSGDTTVWSAEQLAWQVRDRRVPWLTLTGTNGKTTTAQMVHHMLVTGGRRSVRAGNVGRPLVEAVIGATVPFHGDQTVRAQPSLAAQALGRVGSVGRTGRPPTSH